MRLGTVSFANKDTFRGFFSSDIQRRTGTCHKNIPYNNLGTTGTWRGWSDYKVNFNTELDLDVPSDMRR